MFDRYFFYPGREVLETPLDRGLPFEDLYFTSEDGTKLNAWFVKGRSQLTWLWFHGNGGTIADRLDELVLFHHQLGVNILILDYRGYGRSSGRPTEAGVYRDARAALHTLRSRDDVDDSQIVYFGQSLGGAVAVELATQHPPLGLILESTFTSGRDMARLVLPYLPAHLFVWSKFNSLARIKKVESPVLVIHGTQDELVPVGQGWKLYDTSPAPKHWLELVGAGHSALPSDVK